MADRHERDTPLRPLLKRKEAAAMLAIGERKLWSLTNGGSIPHVRIEKSVRYKVEDLREFIEKRRTGGQGS